MSLINEWRALLQRHSLQDGTITITRMEGPAAKAYRTYQGSIKEVTIHGTTLRITINDKMQTAPADQTGLRIGQWERVDVHDPELLEYNLGMVMTTPPVESPRGIVFTSLTAQVILQPAATGRVA